MKKLLIPALLLGVAFTASLSHAETMSGKVVAKENNMIQVQSEGSNTPTTFKTNDQTDYYVKKKIKKDHQHKDRKRMVENDEFVEIIYTIDPKTNELIIDELIMIVD